MLAVSEVDCRDMPTVVLLLDGRLAPVGLSVAVVQDCAPGALVRKASCCSSRDPRFCSAVSLAEL